MASRAIEGARLLAPKDLAKALGISTSRVKQLTADGTLRGVRVSNGNTVYMSALLPYFEKQLAMRREAYRAKRSADQHD